MITYFIMYTPWIIKNKSNGFIITNNNNPLQDSSQEAYYYS